VGEEKRVIILLRALPSIVLSRASF